MQGIQSKTCIRSRGCIGLRGASEMHARATPQCVVCVVQLSASKCREHVECDVVKGVLRAYA